MIQEVVIVAVSILALWLAFVAFVWIAKPDQTSLRDALRLLPDTLRLLRRLVADRTIPRRTRWLVWALLGYLVFPIDLVPDFLPVIGYADDAIITSLVLRHVISKAGPAKLHEHWTGSAEGLAALQRLLRLTS
jgi:uncharacterized membrane protein YkvA (DUF1232 family)